MSHSLHSSADTHFFRDLAEESLHIIRTYGGPEYFAINLRSSDHPGAATYFIQEGTYTYDECRNPATINRCRPDYHSPSSADKAVMALLKTRLHQLYDCVFSVDADDYTGLVQIEITYINC